MPSKEAKLIFLTLSMRQEQGHPDWIIGYHYKGMSYKKRKQVIDELKVQHVILEKIPIVFHLNPNRFTECDPNYLISLYEVTDAPN